MSFNDLRIMIVDDNANMRRLIVTILRSVGIENILETPSATEALTQVVDWAPDLLLVDYVMDGLDGVEFTRRIRAEVDIIIGRRLPIIILTGYSELWRLTEAKKAGADDFIVKPFTTRALVTRIQRLMAGEALVEAKEA